MGSQSGSLRTKTPCGEIPYTPWSSNSPQPPMDSLILDSSDNQPLTAPRSYRQRSRETTRSPYITAISTRTLGQPISHPTGRHRNTEIVFPSHTGIVMCCLSINCTMLIGKPFLCGNMRLMVEGIIWTPEPPINMIFRLPSLASPSRPAPKNLPPSSLQGDALDYVPGTRFSDVVKWHRMFARDSRCLLGSPLLSWAWPFGKGKPSNKRGRSVVTISMWDCKITPRLLIMKGRAPEWRLLKKPRKTIRVKKNDNRAFMGLFEVHLSILSDVAVEVALGL